MLPQGFFLVRSFLFFLPINWHPFPSSIFAPLISSKQNRQSRRTRAIEQDQSMGSRVLISSYANGFNFWHTPIPYLYGGLGPMMILIVIPLMVLACSHRKSSTISDHQSTASAPEEACVRAPIDLEPRFVVIVAGEEKPTFLAKPVPSVHASSSLQQS